MKRWVSVPIARSSATISPKQWARGKQNLQRPLIEVHSKHWGALARLLWHEHWRRVSGRAHREESDVEAGKRGEREVQREVESAPPVAEENLLQRAEEGEQPRAGQRRCHAAQRAASLLAARVGAEAVARPEPVLRVPASFWATSERLRRHRIGRWWRDEPRRERRSNKQDHSHAVGRQQTTYKPPVHCAKRSADSSSLETRLYNFH